MADVTRERGQLILVTGLIVAVAIVGLVILLNTAIFTENLASRGADQSGREAIEYRTTTVDGITGLLASENRRPHRVQSAVEENVSAGVGLLDEYTAMDRATGGTVVRINDTTIHPGKYVRQNATGRRILDSSGGGGGVIGWRLASDIRDVRRFNLTVQDDSNLVETNDTRADLDGAFHLTISESGVGTSEWRVYVYENQTTNDLAIATADGVSTPVERCTVPGTEPAIRLNFTAGTVGGNPCPALDWADGVPAPYHLEFHNGANATGTYQLTVNTSGAGQVETANVNHWTTTTDSPFFFPAVYDVTFGLTYQSTSLTYRDRIRIAPGEPK